MAKSSSIAAAEASAMRKKPSVAYDAIALRNTFDQTLLLPLVTSILLIVYVNYIKLYNAYPCDSNAVFSLL